MPILRVMCLAGLLSVAACSGAAERIAENAMAEEFGGEVDIEGEAYTVTDDTGSMRVSTELPPNLSVPVLNGGEIVSAMERATDTEATWAVRLRYPVERYDDIIRFYETFAAGREEPMVQTTSDDYLQTTWTSSSPLRVIEVVLDPTAVAVTIVESG